MVDGEKIIKGLHDIGGWIAGRLGIEKARNFIRTLDDAIELLKEQNLRIFDLLTENEQLAQMLREQENITECIKGKCRICPHCKRCDVDENGLLKDQHGDKRKIIRYKNGNIKKMTDREKVIKALRNHVVQNDVGCQGCPYFEDRKVYGHDWCTTVMAQDILELLKEQETVKPVLDEQTGRIWLCGNCGTYVGFEDNDPHDPNEFDKYCRECGKPVLWEGR